jgi:hypothetical protein
MDVSRIRVMRLVRGPIMLIALGVLFELHQFTEYSFWRTWPVLVILYGVLWLLERLGGAGNQTKQYARPGGAA